MRILDHRPGWAIALLLAAAALLAACAPSSAKPAGGQSRAATPAGVASDAIRLQMAGFAGGPGFRLPEDLSADFRAAVSALWSGEVEAESAACPPGDGGGGREVGAAKDG